MRHEPASLETAEEAESSPAIGRAGFCCFFSRLEEVSFVDVEEVALFSEVDVPLSRRGMERRLRKRSRINAAVIATSASSDIVIIAVVQHIDVASA